MRLNYTGNLFNYTAGKYQLTRTDNISVFKDGQSINSEYWGKIINTTHLPSYASEVPYNIELVKQDLQFLNARLDYLRKTITFWDSYQIKGTIEDSTDIFKINNLEEGQSLIISSSDNIKWNGVDCRRGGVFVNTFDQGIIYIEPVSSGIYVPKLEALKQDGETTGMRLSYDFSDNINAVDFQQDFQFTKNEIYYNGVFFLEEIEEGKMPGVESSIIPVVKFIFPNKGGEEEIIIDHTLKLTGNNITINIPGLEKGVDELAVMVRIK